MSARKITGGFFKKIPIEIKYTIALFLVTRIVLIIIGVMARDQLGPFNNYYHPFAGHVWLDIWGVWDSSWYVDIAKNGYTAEFMGPDASRGWGNYGNYAFFPLYPILMKAFGALIGNVYVAGIIISNIALLFACYFLYKLVLLDADKDAALRSIKYLLLFPSAFVLSGLFTEGLFLMLAIMCFYFAKSEKWFFAGTAGFFLALTKHLGVLVLIPLLYQYLAQRNFKFKEIRFNIFSLLLIPIGWSLFSVYNFILTGDPLAFAHIQTSWGHHLSNPFGMLLDAFNSGGVDRFQSIFTIVSIILLIIFFKKIGFAQWLFGMYTIFIPLSSGLMYSALRYILVVFPIFIIFAYLSKNRLADNCLTISLALLQGFLMVFWVTQAMLVV